MRCDGGEQCQREGGPPGTFRFHKEIVRRPPGKVSGFQERLRKPSLGILKDPGSIAGQDASTDSVAFERGSWRTGTARQNEAGFRRLQQDDV